MTSTELDGTPWPTLCEAIHPTQPVMCALVPGPNGTNQEGREVHVHKGLAPNGDTHRWEDVPPDQES